MEQNLQLQVKNRRILMGLHPGTERFDFSRVGSWVFLILSLVAAIGLTFVAI